MVTEQDRAGHTVDQQEVGDQVWARRRRLLAPVYVLGGLDPAQGHRLMIGRQVICRNDVVDERADLSNCIVSHALDDGSPRRQASVLFRAVNSSWLIPRSVKWPYTASATFSTGRSRRR